MREIKKIARICAIALLLAGCSQEIQPPSEPDPNDAPEATVTLRFEQDQAKETALLTRRLVADAQDYDDRDIKKLFVLFFDKKGKIIGKVNVLNIEGDKTVKNIFKIKTTIAARKVVVLGNLYEDHVGNVKNVKTLDDMKALEIESPLDKYEKGLYLQRPGHITMSAYAPVNMEGTTGTAKAKLHPMVARIDEVNISWGPLNKGKLANKESQLSKAKPFTFKRVFVMMANNRCPFLPDGDLAAPDWSDDSHHYTSKGTPLSFTGGIDWQTSWGTKPEAIKYMKSTSFLMQLDPLRVGAKDNPRRWSLEIEDITTGENAGGQTIGSIFKYNSKEEANGRYKFYMHENNSKEHPTGIVVEAIVMVKNPDKAQAATKPYLKKTKYFPVYFGEEGEGGKPGLPPLKAGKSYKININFIKPFDPDLGTYEQPGSDDPTKPLPSASKDITVTVKTAPWEPPVDYSKEL